MRYHISHRTRYEYEQDVSLSHHIARLTVRELPHQRRLQHRITTLPVETTRCSHLDHFGNTSTFLTIEGPHRRLEITAVTQLEVHAPARPDPARTVPWETIRDQLTDPITAPAEVAEFVFPSPAIPPRAEFGEYAARSFPASRPILEAACDLNHRVHQDFRFDARATSISTPVVEFFKTRRGVCQDFAQFMIACLRSLGLSARYVSGYLETLPPPGRPKLVGADASHAWLSVWCGPEGWVDLDPTNDVLPSYRHITTAWGRGFSDISPLRGVMIGSGTHHLDVAVDVTPAPDSLPAAAEGATEEPGANQQQQQQG